MTFFSTAFLALVLAALVLYYLLPGKYRWLVLLAASLAFYLWGSLRAGAYLGFTILTTYAGGRLLGTLNARRKAPDPKTDPGRQKEAEARIKRQKRLVLAVCLLLNFGLLFTVRYWNFTAETLANATAGRLALPAVGLVMPLGLSFYMFQSAGYAIDCYRGKYPPERSLLKFALFASFFPQLVQGPISRFDQLAPQLTEPHPFDARNLKFGIQRVLWGFFKKLVIADRASVVVKAVLGNLEGYGGAMYAMAILAYCIQLYCDFCGGMDIALGIAEMFGVHMAENFRRPIFATSLADYWRRWHITLGAWMRDYVFYSLSLSRTFVKLGSFTRRRFKGKMGKVIPTSLATFVVYLIIGIWHGANFRYIFYGLWNGAIITSSLLLAAPYAKIRARLRIREDGRLYRWFRVLRTMGLVFVGRYITCAPRLLTAAGMLKKTLLHPCLYQLRDGSLRGLGLTGFDFAVVLLGILAVLYAEWRMEHGLDIRARLEEQGPFVQWVFLFVPLAVVCFLGIFRGSAIQAEFIYQQY